MRNPFGRRGESTRMLPRKWTKKRAGYILRQRNEKREDIDKSVSFSVAGQEGIRDTDRQHVQY